MPPQKGQLELPSETLFWHLGLRHRATNRMVMNVIYKVNLKLTFTVNQQQDLRNSTLVRGNLRLTGVCG
jgi:hypothetical protein